MSSPALCTSPPIQSASSSPNESPPFIPQLDPIIEHVEYFDSKHGRQALERQHTRGASTLSHLSFKIPSTSRRQAESPVTVEGDPKASRRPVSPSRPNRYRNHVSFDNFKDGETTTNNIVSFTLNLKHSGHQFKRQSRTFMVGIDENDYSDTALIWLLEELVEDGDEIVCVTVMDKDDKIVNDRNVANKGYQRAAKDLMSRIQKKSEKDQDRAIGITLEFAVGKLHTTILKMIQLYAPAMLIVGTRGRSLAGIQGLVANRNSFSKWCLQYSPVPVVVVRPPEKRLKKKNKRELDPTRQDYARILKESGLDAHETRNGSRRNSVFETPIPKAVEAQAVADALGLPDLDYVASTLGRVGSVARGSPLSRSVTQHDVELESVPLVQLDEEGSVAEESSEGEESSEEAEFEVSDGRALVGDRDSNLAETPENDKKKKLHEMEVDEAAALSRSKSRDRTASLGSVDSGDGDVGLRSL